MHDSALHERARIAGLFQLASLLCRQGHHKKAPTRCNMRFQQFALLSSTRNRMKISTEGLKNNSFHAWICVMSRRRYKIMVVGRQVLQQNGAERERLGACADRALMLDIGA